MADYKLLSAVLADYADKAGTAESADTATTATTAEIAIRLSAGTVGSASVPVYFSNGVPVAATEVSSGGVSWKKTVWSENTYQVFSTQGNYGSFSMTIGSTKSVTSGTMITLEPASMKNMFLGFYLVTESSKLTVCGTWYDYELATTVSGFWSETEFDEYVEELIGDTGYTAFFHYLA